MNIAAIARNPKNSPGMCDKDRAILLSTVEKLLERGDNVLLLTEEQYAADNNRYDIIVSMSRNSSTLQKLSQAQINGTIVINTPQAVCNCSRKNLVYHLNKHNIPQPTQKIISSKDSAPSTGYPIWIKKSNGWSEHKDDVCYAATPHEAEKALLEFKNRGIEEVHICNHIQGDIIKFYGIGDSFFKLSYPNPNDTKFGLEKINGTTRQYPFNIEKLKSIALLAARSIGVEIFGGDAIITPEGSIYIIDINDFPSFSAVRHEAAQAISNLIKTKSNEYRR